MTQSHTLQLVGIIGSLRVESVNRSVFRAALELLGPNVTLTEVSLQEVPLYNGDVESQGDPAAVSLLKEQVASADGLIVFTPEYNRSVPAVTKNVIDWLSRLPGKSVLSDSAVAIVAASPGRHDAAGVREHLSTSISANTKRLYDPTLGIASIGHKLSDGRLSDEDTRNELKAWLAGFVSFLRSNDG